MQVERLFTPGISPECDSCTNKLSPDPFPNPYYPCKAVTTNNKGDFIFPETRNDNICESYRPTFGTSLRNYVSSLLTKAHFTVNAIGRSMPPF